MLVMSSGAIWLKLWSTASPIGPEAEPWPGACPCDRYETRSASLQLPRPVALSEEMLKARQPAVMAPANFLRLSSAKPRLRGVWHSPQCASASARYAPLFHSGLFDVSGANRVSGLNTADQNIIAQRWLNGNESVLSGALPRTAGWLDR